jgi:hypothetical protein
MLIHSKRGTDIMKNETRKQIYFLGSLWNFNFAFTGLVLPGLTMWLISGSKSIITGVLPRTFFAFFWGAVGVFGWGYYLVSRDPEKNQGIIWMGCLAKVIIFLTMTGLYLRKFITLFGFLCALGDLIWTILFLAALRGEKLEEKV